MARNTQRTSAGWRLGGSQFIVSALVGRECAGNVGCAVNDPGTTKSTSKPASRPEGAVAAIRPDAPLEPPAPPILLGAEELLIHPDPDTAATEAPAGSATVAEPDRSSTTDAIPAAKPNAEKSRPLPKPKVAQKKRVRTARPAEPANSAGTASSPFALPGNSHP